LSRMVLHTAMQLSQMYTPGPAMSFLTSAWLLPQKEQMVRLEPRAMPGEGLDKGNVARQASNAQVNYGTARAHFLLGTPSPDVKMCFLLPETAEVGLI
jgi:hypothetical protein